MPTPSPPGEISRAPRIARQRPGSPEARASPASSCLANPWLTLAGLGLDGGHGGGQELGHHPADFGVGNGDPLAVEILADFTPHVPVALFHQVGLAHRLDVII